MITICDIVLAWVSVGLVLGVWEWWVARSARRARVTGQQQHLS